MQLDVDGVGPVEVDDSFASLPQDQQIAYVSKIQALHGAGTYSGTATLDGQPGQNQPAQQQPQDDTTHNPLSGAVQNVLSTVAGIGKAVDDVDQAAQGGPLDWLTQHGSFNNPQDGWHWTKTANDEGYSLPRQLADGADSAAASINYTPSVSAKDVTGPLSAAQAIGERALTNLPYLAGLPAAIAGGIGTFGNTADARAANDDRDKANGTDLAASLAPAAASFFLDRLPSFGGLGSGITGAANKAILATGAGAAQGAMQNAAETAGTQTGSTAGGILNGAEEGALNGLGNVAGSAGMGAVGNLAGRGASAAADTVINNPKIADAYAQNPDAVTQAVRIGNQFDATKQAIQSENAGRSTNVSDDQVFKRMQGDTLGQLNDAIGTYQKAGVLGPDDIAVMKQAVENARRHNQPMASDGSTYGIPDQPIDLIGQMALPDADKSTFINGLRDLNVITSNALQKNTSGPMQDLAQKYKGNIATAGGSAGFGLAGLMNPALTPIGAMAGSGLAVNTANGLARSIDSALGQNGPSVLRLKDQQSDYLSKQGVSPGNVTDPLAALIAQYLPQAQQAQQQATAQRQQNAATMAALRGVLSDEGGEYGGGPLAAMQQAMAAHPTNPVKLSQQDILGQAKQLVDDGKLPQADYAALATNQSPFGGANDPFYALQDAIHARALNSGQGVDSGVSAPTPAGTPDQGLTESPQGILSGMANGATSDPSIRNPLAYAATAKANQDRVTAAIGRVQQNDSLTPGTQAALAQALALIGNSTNKADAKTHQLGILSGLTDPDEIAAANSEMLPLIAQIRRKGPPQKATPILSLGRGALSQDDE